MRDTIQEVLTKLCKAYDNGSFIPIVEADVIAYVYYLVVDVNQGCAANIHVYAPVSGSGKKRRPDIVLGPVMGVKELLQPFIRKVENNVEPSTLGLSSTEELGKVLHSRGFRDRFRPLAQQDTIIEVKAFLPEVRPQYWRNAFVNLTKDLEVLETCPASEKLLILFDSVGYLQRNYDKLTALRQTVEGTTTIIAIGRGGDGELRWTER